MEASPETAEPRAGDPAAYRPSGVPLSHWEVSCAGDTLHRDHVSCSEAEVSAVEGQKGTGV